jgi:glycosyltransferase involved in cell wall biosynthesis
MASSFARAGYRSIVAEGKASDCDFSALGIKVVGLFATAAENGQQVAVQANRDTLPDVKTPSLVLGFRRAVLSPFRKFYRLMPTSIRELWTLALHVKAIWHSAGRSALQRLPVGDLYYVHAFEYAPALAMRRWSRNSPMIYDAHDLYDDLLVAGEPTRFVKRYVRRINRLSEGWLVRKASACITTSQAMADELTAKYRFPFEVICNAHDPRSDLPDAQAVGLRARLAATVPAEALIIVSIGNVKEGHDFSGIAAAIAQRGGKTHVVGIGDGYERVAECFQQAGVGSCLHSLGRLPARELVPAIKDADAAILPYHPVRLAYEVFLPNGFCQAVAAGLPILYPRAIPEINRLASENGLGWAIDPLQADSITSALTMLDDPDTRRAVAENLRRFAEVFNWLAEEKKLLAIVERMLAR